MWVYDVMIVWNFARINNTPLSFDLRTISSHTHMAELCRYISREHHRIMKNNVHLELLNSQLFDCLLSSGGETKA